MVCRSSNRLAFLRSESGQCRDLSTATARNIAITRVKASPNDTYATGADVRVHACRQSFAWHDWSMSDGSQESYYHGTRADLMLEDLIQPGYNSNFGSRKQANHVYLTAIVDTAVWGAELAIGEGPGRIYVVEPTGVIEDDPNVTDKKFPGNPTQSYRSRHPLRVTGEITSWEGHGPDVLQAMRDRLERLKLLGIEAIDD
jgi:hypothetical protein